jgi:hypothetical protein
MRRRYRQESGQAAVLIVLALAGLIAFAALAIDAGRLYAERRQAQNAADNAALAASRAMCLGDNFKNAALLLANQNGYDNDGDGDIVTISNPPTTGEYAGNANYIEVSIVSNFPAALLHFIRPGGLQITARAVSMCFLGPSSGIPAIYAGSETCVSTLLWSGEAGLIQGGFHSNNDPQITGQNTSVIGASSFVSGIHTDYDKVIFNPPPPGNPMRSRVVEDPLNLNVEDYAPGGSKAVLAQAAGQYVYRDGNIDINWLKHNGYYVDATDTILDGLYYATGNITITGTGVIGNAVTLVAEGDVWYRGPNQIISSYVDNLLAFSAEAFANDATACNTPVIRFSHSDGVYQGNVYAPHGLINVSGSDIQFFGSLIGYDVTVTGSGVSVITPGGYVPPPPGRIEITE